MLRRFLFALSKYLKNIIEKVDSILKGALWEEKKKKKGHKLQKVRFLHWLSIFKEEVKKQS